MISYNKNLFFTCFFIASIVLFSSKNQVCVHSATLDELFSHTSESGGAIATKPAVYLNTTSPLTSSLVFFTESETGTFEVLDAINGSKVYSSTSPSSLSFAAPIAVKSTDLSDTYLVAPCSNGRVYRWTVNDNFLETYFTPAGNTVLGDSQLSTSPDRIFLGGPGGVQGAKITAKQLSFRNTGMFCGLGNKNLTINSGLDLTGNHGWCLGKPSENVKMYQFNYQSGAGAGSKTLGATFLASDPTVFLSAPSRIVVVSSLTHVVGFRDNDLVQLWNFSYPVEMQNLDNNNSSLSEYSSMLTDPIRYPAFSETHGLVYTISAGFVFAINTTTGSLAWSTFSSSHSAFAWNASGALLLHERTDILYVATEGVGRFALNALTGEIVTSLASPIHHYSAGVAGVGSALFDDTASSTSIWYLTTNTNLFYAFEIQYSITTTAALTTTSTTSTTTTTTTTTSAAATSTTPGLSASSTTTSSTTTLVPPPTTSTSGGAVSSTSSSSSLSTGTTTTTTTTTTSTSPVIMTTATNATTTATATTTAATLTTTSPQKPEEEHEEEEEDKVHEAKEISTSVGTGGVVAGGVSLLSVPNPVVATTVSRTALLQRLGNCDNNKNKNKKNESTTRSTLSGDHELPAYKNPLRLSIDLSDSEDEEGRKQDSYKVRYLLGSAVGNLIIVLAIGFLSLCFAACHQVYFSSQNSKNNKKKKNNQQHEGGEKSNVGFLGIQLSSLAVARPAAIVFPLLFFLQQIVSACLIVATLSTEKGAMISIAVLVVLGGVVIFLIVPVLSSNLGAIYSEDEENNNNSKKEIEEEKQKEMTCARKIDQFYTSKIERPYGKWVDKNKEEYVVARIGAAFDCYRGSRRWFLLLEILFSVIFGIIEAAIEFTSSSSCLPLSVATLSLFILLIILIVIIKPYINRFDFFCVVCINLSNLAAAVLPLVLNDGDDTSVLATAIVASCGTFLAIGWTLITCFTACIRLMIDLADKKQEEEDKEKQQQEEEEEEEEEENESKEKMKGPRRTSVEEERGKEDIELQFSSNSLPPISEEGVFSAPLLIVTSAPSTTSSPKSSSPTTRRTENNNNSNANQSLNVSQNPNLLVSGDGSSSSSFPPSASGSSFSSPTTAGTHKAFPRPINPSSSGGSSDFSLSPSPSVSRVGSQRDLHNSSSSGATTTEDTTELDFL